VIIAGEKVLLRPVLPADMEILKAWDDDPTIIELVGKKFISSGDSAGESMRRPNTSLAYAITEASSKHLIGNLELEDICWRKRSAEMRICIGDKDYWGHGFGRDAISALINHVFGATRLEHIYLRVYRTNQRAISCYKSCGFRPEAVLRAGTRSREGHEDLLLMSLHKPASYTSAHNAAAGLAASS